MIAIIPARQGSKRLKNKNLRLLQNKPLIHWTIKAAQKSKFIKKVFVSTDCKKILSYSKKIGALDNGLRPKKLAKDKSNAIDTYLYEFRKIHKITNCEKNFIVLLPTSPLRSSKQIDEAIKIFKKNKVKSLISCKKIEKNYFNWQFELKGKKNLVSVPKKNKKKLMRNASELHNYAPNGAIYIINYDMIKKKLSYYSYNTCAYIMDSVSSIDIDTQNDFDYCEFLNRKYKLLKN